MRAYFFLFVFHLELETVVSRFGSHLSPVLLHTHVCGTVRDAPQLESLTVLIYKTLLLNVV